MLASSESVFCIKFLFKKIFKVSETNLQSELIKVLSILVED